MPSGIDESILIHALGQKTFFADSDDRHPNDPTDHRSPRHPVPRQEAIDPVAGRSSPRAPCGCHMKSRSRTILGLLLVALVGTVACTRRPGGGTRITADVDSGPLVPLPIDPEPVNISPAPALPSAPAPMTSTSLAMGTTTPWVDATRSSHATTAVRAFGSLVRVADSKRTLVRARGRKRVTSWPLQEASTSS